MPQFASGASAAPWTQSAAPSPARPSRPSIAATLRRAPSFDVPVTVSLGLGIALAVIMLWRIRASQPSMLATIMLERGPYQHLSLFLAAAASAFVLGKGLQIVRGTRALSAAREAAMSGDWYPEHEVDSSLRDQLLATNDPVTVRQARALQAYLVTGSRSAAAAAAEEDAVLAQQTMESGYSVPRALIWAIPLMGFIGTVIGISTAVNGFSGFLQQAEEIEQIKEGINAVTTGLAVAFDTTFVALALSVLVMLPLVLVERLEARLLAAIDALVGDSVVARLPESDRDTPIDPEALSITLRDAVRQHMPPPQALVASAETYMKNAAETIAAAAKASAEAATQSARASAEQIRQAGVILRDYQLSALQELRTQADQLARPLAEASALLESRLAQGSTNGTRTEEVLAREQQFLETVRALETSGELRRTLTGLEALLQQLGPAVERLGQPREFMFVERARVNGAGHAPEGGLQYAPR